MTYDQLILQKFLSIMLLGFLAMVPYIIARFFLSKNLKSRLKKCWQNAFSSICSKTIFYGFGFLCLVCLVFYLGLKTGWLGFVTASIADYMALPFRPRLTLTEGSPFPVLHKQLIMPIAHEIWGYFTNLDRVIIQQNLILNEAMVNDLSNDIAHTLNFYIETINQRAISLSHVNLPIKLLFRKAAQMELANLFFLRGSKSKFFGIFNQEKPHLPGWHWEYNHQIGFSYVQVQNLIV